MGTNYGGWPNAGNRAPAGRLLVLDDSSVYGFGRNQYIHHGAHVGIDGATVFHFKPKRDAARRFTHYHVFATDRREGAAGAPKRRGAKASPKGKQYRWTQRLPLLARALVLAGDALLVAGPPDFFSTDKPAAAFEGGEGGSLYVLSAACAGLAGVLYAARFNAGAAQAGEPLLLDSVAAVVIGGASLFGGSGTILGTVAGALVIAVIQYGLVFVNVEPFWQFISVGIVIIISVLIDQAQRRFSGGRQDE